MLLLLTDFEKGFVRQHTRKTGTVVQAHFTKRLPGKVQEKHVKERFYDHDKTSAKKAHEELESKKAKHQFLLEAAQKHHDELKKQGPKEDEKGLTHKEKLSHLQSEIKNQQTNIDNHSRKQSHIKNRYQISSKQIVRKKSKADLEKRIESHSEEQKKTIRDIHKAHQEGKSNLEPGKVLTGKDKDHIYLEAKHKDTGKTHHVAIHKDGSVKDPQVLHGGKFDSKSLKESRKEKEVVVKKPVEKKPTKGKSLDQLFKDYYSAPEQEKAATAKLAKDKFMSENPGSSFKDYLEAARKADPGGENLKRKPKGVVVQKSDAKNITLDSGSRISYFTKDRDFPGEKIKSDRAEIYYVESKKRGEGKKLFKDALNEIKASGASTVVISPQTKAGKKLTEKMISTGVLGKPIKSSESGKLEFDISGEKKTEPDKPKREPKKVVVKKPVEKEVPKSEAEEKKNRSEAMKGNKNAWKGGPKEDEKPAVAAFTKTKSQLDKAIEKFRTGKETMVITARSKDKHKVKYKVIEADDENLIASNHIDGKINKDYPSLDVKGALQMRDRSNIQSKAQINQMSNDLEPMFLTDSKIASDGAPIVGSDYKGKEGHSVVESGNGRVMAIRTAYENGKAGHYKEHLIDEAESFGIDSKTIKGMKNPILIRERVDKMSDEEKAKFAKESNKATVSQMTAVEQAIEDSNYLGQLSNLKVTDSGRITHKNNSQFVKDFFSQVMDNDPREVGKLLNRDGQLNDEGERRLTNAVFTRVYGSHSDVMNKLIMKDTDKTKKITAGMLAAAPRMAQFKQTMQENDRHDLDISGNFIDALTAMEDLKKSGISLEEKLQTVDWADLGVKEDYINPLKNPDVVDILKMIQEHGTGLTGSANKVSSLLTNYADEAEKAIHAEDPDKLTIEDAMGIARDKQMKATKGTILKQAKDEVAFLQADRKGKKESYQKYLDEYPGGKFSAEAKEKLKRLSKPEEPDKTQASF